MAAYSGVRTTGIYCRPECGASPKQSNVSGFPLAASAEAAGYRACYQCRPYRTAQPVALDAPELVCRAVQRVLDGALDCATEERLAAGLGVSVRHLRRLFGRHLGVTPDALARSARAHFARRLLDDTDLSVTEITFAAGFGSVRQFNRVCQEIFRDSPRNLRARRRKSDRLVADGGLALRLPFRGPLDWQAILEQLDVRAIPGVEAVRDGVYRRTIVVAGEPGVLELVEGGADHLVLRLHLPHWRELIHVARRARRIAGLDAHADSPVRAPGDWDVLEAAARAIAGASATRVLGRLACELGTPIDGLAAFGLTHSFPDAATLADADLEEVGLSPRQARLLTAFAEALAGGELVPAPGDGLALDEDVLAAIDGIDRRGARSIVAEALAR